VLSGPLIFGVLSNAVVLRAAYGFLVLFLAFSIRSHDLTRSLFGQTLPDTWALAVAVGALGAGSFVATAIGSRLRIRRPLLLQAIGFAVVAATGILACIWYSLGTVIVASLAIAIVGGLAKLAVDASIQERIAEDVRASAFAHSETLLMLAFVVGGGIGLIPFNGRLGIIVSTAAMVVAAIYAWLRAIRLRTERLSGSAAVAPAAPSTGPQSTTAQQTTAQQTTAQPTVSQPIVAGPSAAQTTRAQPTTPQATAPQQTTAQSTIAHPSASDARTVELPGGTTYQRGHYVHGEPSAPAGSWWARRRAARAARADTTPTDRGNGSAGAPPPAGSPPPASSGPSDVARPGSTRVLPRTDDDQPGFHIYRPSSGRSESDDATGP
jgi:hypothetical protein